MSGGRSFDAAVIGAGAFGSSVAFHLARGGRRVAVLDRGGPVSQSSPRAAGLTLQVRSDPAHAWLARRSVEMIEAFEQDTGESVAFRQPGSVKLTRRDELVPEIVADAELGNELGLETRLVGPRDIEALAPWVNAAGVKAAWYTPSDLYLEPAALPQAYLRAAKRLGAVVMANTPVTAIHVDSGSVREVVSGSGRLQTELVVDTAGAWCTLVAGMAGVDVPTLAVRHQLYVTEPVEMVEPDHPIVRVAESNVYVRPCRGGLMLGGYEPDPLVVDVGALAPGFDMSELALDPAPLRRLTDEVTDLLPVLAHSEIAELRGGLPTMTADGKLIVDRAPGVEGLFVIGGCCVGGLSVSPAVGEAVGAWVARGRPPIDLSAFSLTRFGDRPGGPEALRERCLAAYSRKYETSHRESR